MVAQPCKYIKSTDTNTFKGQFYDMQIIPQFKKIVWDRVLENYKYRGSLKSVVKDIMKSKPVFHKYGWRTKAAGYKLYLNSV